MENNIIYKCISVTCVLTYQPYMFLNLHAKLFSNLLNSNISDESSDHYSFPPHLKWRFPHYTPYLILLSSGDMAPVVLVAAVTSILVTGCVGPAAAPSTWPVSPAPPVSASCPLGRSVESLRIGSFVCHTTKWWWKTSGVLRKMVSL